MTFNATLLDGRVRSVQENLDHFQPSRAFQLVTVALPETPNSPFEIPHQLRVRSAYTIRWTVLQSQMPVFVYRDRTDTWNSKLVTLRATAAGGQIVLLLSVDEKTDFAEVGVAADAAMMTIPGIVTADQFYRPDYVEAAQGEWTTYTPAWTAASVNPAVGNGTLVGRYTIVGTTVHYKIQLTAGSTTTFGTGAWSFSLPLTSDGASDSTALVRMLDSGTREYTGHTAVGSSTTVIPVSAATGGAVDSATPHAWATSDLLIINGTYVLP